MQAETLIKIDIVKIQMVKDGTIEYGKKQISKPQDLAELGHKFLKNVDREMFVLVCLNTKNYVNCIHLVSIGTLNGAVLSPRDVIKAVLLSNSANVAFIHNHPSGHVEPSPEDLQLTQTLTRCAELFDITVLDHVIIADDGQYGSFLEKGLLKHNYPPIRQIKDKAMNAYTKEFLKQYAVKEKMFKTKPERDTEVRQLKEDGWEVTSKKFHFGGDERYFVTAIRRKEQSL
jgi:DNA repair protein RadC